MIPRQLRYSFIHPFTLFCSMTLPMCLLFGLNACRSQPEPVSVSGLVTGQLNGVDWTSESIVLEEEGEDSVRMIMGWVSGPMGSRTTHYLTIANVSLLAAPSVFEYPGLRFGYRRIDSGRIHSYHALSGRLQFDSVTRLRAVGTFSAVLIRDTFDSTASPPDTIILSDCLFDITGINALNAE